MDNKLTIRILVVADGPLNFEVSKNNADSLHLALSQLTHSNWFNFDLTYRRRGSNTFHDLNSFDQLWLFGAEYRVPLERHDITNIESFMNSGKGLFATGDHGKLGSALSGDIPRLRAMRSWDRHGIKKPNDDESGFTFVMKDYLMENRLDSRTSKNPLDVRGEDLEASLEGDHVPKVLEPRLQNLFGQTRAHFILTMPNGHPIRVLPDHIHEGECLEPTVDHLDFKSRARPQIIADAYTKAGRTNGAAYNMRSVRYGVVAVYDPIIINQENSTSATTPEDGRIVTDSTFHHWKNGNVRPFFSERNNDTRAATTWGHIRQYYLNIASWLVPRSKRIKAFRQCIDKVTSYECIGNTLDSLDIGVDETRLIAANAIIAELEKQYGEAFIAEYTCDSLHDHNTLGARAIQHTLEKLQRDNLSSYISHSIFKTLQEEVIAQLYNNIKGVECDSPFKCAAKRIKLSNEMALGELDTIDGT